MRIWVGVCLVSWISVGAAAAQTSTGGSVRGYVKDEQDAIVRGVTLTATSPDAPGSYSATSDDEGYYRLLELPPGTYTIRAERDGFSTWVRDGIGVRSGLNLSVLVVMKIGNRNETVEVKAESPLLESRSSTQTVNISGDLQRDVPLSGRRHWADSLLLAPGVVSSESSNNTQFFYLHGSDFGSNTLQLDGADVAASVQGTPGYIGLSTEAIQDVQIKGGAVDASSPLGLGAALNVTTKSGTNDLRGAASVVFHPQRWNDNNVTGGTATTTSFTQPDLALGGPIVKDNWWFFGSYRRLSASTGVSRTAAQIAAVRALVPGFVPFDLASDANLYFVKTSLALGPAHRLSGSYQRDPSATESGGSDVVAVTRRIQGGNNTHARLQSVWSGSFTTQASVSYNDRGVSTQAGNGDQPLRTVYQSVALSGGRLSGVGRVAGYGASASINSLNPGQKLSIGLDGTWLKQGWNGFHQFQAGLFLQPRLAQRVALEYVNGGAAVEDRILLDPSDPSKGSRVYHTTTWDTALQQSTDLSGSDTAFYLQDSWNPIKSLTVNAGVRLDLIRRSDHIFQRPTQRSHETGPRAGLTYVLTDDGFNVARVSWSRVHETPVQNWISLGSSAAGFTDRYDMNGDGSLETIFPTSPSTALNSSLVLDVNRFHQPYADEWNAGYRRQFPGRVALDVSFTSRDLKDGIAYVETNGIYDNGVFRGYRDETLLSINQVTNNAWNWQVVRGIDLTVTKQTERTQLIATYSRQWRHLSGTWQPNDPASFIQPGAFADNRGIGRQNDTNAANQNSLSGSALVESFGPSAQWRDHVARLGASYTAPGDVTLAADTSVESGPWSGPVVTRIAAPDPAFGPTSVRLSNGRIVPNPLATTFRFAGVTRSDGQFTLPTYVVLNLRVGKTLTVGPAKLNVALEGFNITNHDAPLQLMTSGNVVGGTTFMQGTLVQLPRSMQLSVRATF